MKFKNLSVKQLFSWIMVGQAVSIIVITLTIFIFTKQTSVLLAGILLLLCTFIWFVVCAQILAKRLVSFTSDLCRTIDSMISGNEEPMLLEEQETQFARISHRLSRLYQIMQENRRRVDEERRELQTLVSDISHQVKTPVSNLKMATDTLLEKPMAEAERTDFIRGIRSQTDKLDFLFQALVKTSRLETGVIQLDKETGRLFDTVAQAMSGIVYAAEKKEISVTVDCPEDLTVSHDSKWTSEALFNLLDNAVKYTSAGGKIAVSVVLWEMYVEIKVTDTGKGISESNQAAIFRRFYREEEVHEQQGVGIDDIFAEDVLYTESWCPQYSNRKTVKHWFQEWNTRGKVVVWEIKQFFHKENQTIVEWYFKNGMNNGDIEEFDGISLIEWTEDNKIKSLKEFGCNRNTYNPYQESDTPQFRNQKANWF